MRIISGKYKGRIIPVSPKLKARPTTDKAKEGLFNILNFELDYESIKVLDLFSGTGNISFEFASRGVSDITSVEQRFDHVSHIRKTSNLLGADLSIIRADVFKYLKKCTEQYDVVFADPPFDLDNFKEVLTAIKQSDILKEDGLLIIEHGPEYSFSEDAWFESTRKYGKVNFSFFRRQA